MKVIEYTDYEINDLIRFLEYAKGKKMVDYKEGKITLGQSQYEIGIIKDLIAKMPMKTYSRKNNIDKDLIKKETIIENTKLIKII